MENPRKYMVAIGVVLTLTAFSLVVARGHASSNDTEVLTAADDCEPVSFNAAVGPGTCVGNGETTFGQFVGQLIKERVADEWEFDPDHFSVDSGTTITLVNIGGETHTFTVVGNFGGGLIPILNQLSGNPIPAAGCSFVPSNTNLFVPAGGTASFTTGNGGTLGVGVHKIQCCIHPWMRATVTVGK